MAQTIEMLKIARQDGIEGIVASPHVMNGLYDNSREGIGEAIASVKGAANGVALYPGADVHISRDLLDNARKGALPLINDKNYLLLELPTFVLPPMAELERIIAGLKFRGVTPVITHPERNAAILEDVSILQRLLDLGALCQLTAASITGRFGARVQKACFKMLKKKQVHVVATDAHDVKKRPPVLSEAHSKVANKFGPSQAAKLFISNPFRIVNGEPVN
ncbi:MAG: hypothetical protein M0033_11920 [Nitrospiraceae bacterium]|nr:hypothetical protein [Nitrospiraceae bacterium]